MKKKKKRQTSTNKKNKRRRRISSSEILGILLIFLSVFLLISLISYDSHDPSWAAVSSSNTEVHNYAGRVGASLSETLFQIFGLVSLVFPFAIFYIGIQIFLPEGNKNIVLKTLASSFLILILCSLTFILFHFITWRGAEIPSGGFTGDLFSSILIRYFNHIGTIIVLIGLLILLITFSTRISIGKILRFFWRFFGFAFKEVKIRIVHYRKEKHREKMRRNVIEKYSAPEHEDKKKQRKIGRKIEIKKEPALQKHAKLLTREKYLFPEMERTGDYNFPPLNLLDPGKAAEKIDNNELYQKKEAIEEKLLEFKVEGEVKEYHPGPILTTYEFYPHPGVKVSQVAGLSEDLSLRLGAESIRIQRIPGKSSLGLEVPNNKREIIKIRDIIQSEKFQNSPSKLTFALGKTIHGEVYVTDLSIMPHLLIAGATGSGKSVALNALIASILYKATPDEVKLILIDPKRLEFSLYDGIPHLLCPVVKDPKKTEAVLLNSIRNMEERYHKLGLLKVKNIEQYNQQVKRIRNERKGKLTEEEEKNLTPLPYIVIIIDELSELMMIGAREIEYSIARIAQLARAVGIHLVLATQRPSTDVITGTIKNNFASRIAFHVPSKIDSRVIIDTGGAEKLLGQGDMLFMPPNYPRILRLHCSFISLPESTRVINFIKQQKKPIYDKNILKALKSPVGHFEESDDEKDPLFYKAVEIILLTGQASASYLQRKLKLGYARASRIIDQMEQEGIVGPSEGSKAREILVDAERYLRKIET